MLIDAGWLSHDSIRPQKAEKWVIVMGVPPLICDLKLNQKSIESLENTILDFLRQFLGFVIIPLVGNSEK